MRADASNLHPRNLADSICCANSSRWTPITNIDLAIATQRRRTPP
jgi:hypothetical protein